MEEKEFEIAENLEQAHKEYQFGYGTEEKLITKEDIQALLDGKCLVTDANCGEYKIIIKLAN